MNSFSTSADTIAFLKKGYPELAEDKSIEFVQNKARPISTQQGGRLGVEGSR